MLVCFAAPCPVSVFNRCCRSSGYVCRVFSAPEKLGSLATPLPVPVKHDLVATIAGLVPTAGAARIRAEAIGDHRNGEGDSGHALSLDAVEALADSRGREGAAEADPTADGSGSGSGATGQAHPDALARIFTPDRPPAARGGGVPAVQRGCARGTAARPGAPGRGTKRSRDKLSYIWGFFDLCDKAFSPQSRSNQVFCKCCRNAGKADVPINGRVDTMYSHVASCLAVPPEDREAAAVAGKLERQHRTLATDSNSGAAGPGVVVGPMDALVPRNYSAKQSQDFETEMLKWMLFSCIAYNLLESPLFHSFIRKWIPGIKNIPTRHAMSSTVLERLLGSLSAAVKTVYSRARSSHCRSTAGRAEAAESSSACWRGWYARTRARCQWTSVAHRTSPRSQRLQSW